MDDRRIRDMVQPLPSAGATMEPVGKGAGAAGDTGVRLLGYMRHTRLVTHIELDRSSSGLAR